MAPPVRKLRSARWYAAEDLRSFGHRSRTLQMGYSYEDFRDKPVVAIINTWSDINPCHAHFRTRAEEVKRGVWQAGGFPVELPAMSLSETVRQADDHALPQPPRPRGRGVAAFPPDRRRRADGRLRQDHAGDADGRDQHEPAGDLHARRADAARQLCRPAARLRQRRLEILGGEAGRQDRRRRVAGDGGRHRPLLRHLHDHGHGGDHDGARRDPRLHASRRLGDPRRRFRARPHGERLRPAHRRHDRGGPQAARRSLARLLRERRRRPDGARRLDQCDRPSDRHGRTRRHRPLARRLRPHRARRSGARQHQAVRRFPDGGLLLRRRPAGAARHPRASTRPHRADGQRHDPRRTDRRRQGLQCRRHPPARQPGLRALSAWRCCAATSPRTARS